MCTLYYTSSNLYLTMNYLTVTDIVPLILSLSVRVIVAVPAFTPLIVTFLSFIDAVAIFESFIAIV